MIGSPLNGRDVKAYRVRRHPRPVLQRTETVVDATIRDTFKMAWVRFLQIVAKRVAAGPDFFQTHSLLQGWCRLFLFLQPRECFTRHPAGSAIERIFRKQGKGVIMEGRFTGTTAYPWIISGVVPATLILCDVYSETPCNVAEVFGLFSPVSKQQQIIRRDRRSFTPRSGFRKMQAQQIQETIVCCSSPSTSPGSVTFHDVRTGAALATFKQTNARTHCTDLVETRDGQGGFILSAQQDRSILNVYNYQKVRTERLESVGPADLGEVGPNRSQGRSLGKALMHRR